MGIQSYSVSHTVRGTKADRPSTWPFLLTLQFATTVPHATNTHLHRQLQFGQWRSVTVGPAQVKSAITCQARLHYTVAAV